jgi:Zn-dependent M28 family amino/carboxypeptidase
MKGALASGGEDLDALKDAPFKVLDAGTATITFATESSEIRPPNVVGLLPGSDPVLRDQYVVFSAHMDHVGTGAPDSEGDSIFNGADDDASGTATVVEVAEAFSALTVAPRRSILFVAVSGEEKGLLGSDYFASHPPVGKEEMIANINLDMVGRNAPDTVAAIGQDYSSLGPLVQEVAAARPELGLVVAPDLWPEENLFVRSDHFSFAKNGVAALFFTTGLHDEYHKQSDEVELIDRDKISRIGKLVFYLAWEIANRDEVPTWTEEGRRVVAEAGGG